MAVSSVLYTRLSLSGSGVKQGLAKQRFDPEKFSGVFSSGGSGPPKWLDGLAADRLGMWYLLYVSNKRYVDDCEQQPCIA